MASEPGAGHAVEGRAVEGHAVDTQAVGEGLAVEVIEAWPRTFRSTPLRMRPGATVADALAAAGIAPEAYPAVAVFGERVALDHALAEGDRVELLRPLQADPKDARRRRAAAAKTGRAQGE